MTKHTPTPWLLNAGMRPPRIYAHESPETTICDMPHWDMRHWPERLENATLIVCAVNNHDALVNATEDLADTLEEVLPDLESVAEIREPGPVAGPAYQKLDLIRRVVAEARDVLAASREKSGG